MKHLFLLITLVITVNGVELKLRSGEVIIGYPICENKTTLVLKENGGTVSLFKKMIAEVDGVSLEGKREFMVGDSALLKEKNEIILKNSSQDSCTVRLRRSPEGIRIAEKKIGPGEQTTIAVTDGSYFETVRYWRLEEEYFTVGNPVTINTKCSTFERIEIELKGFIGETIPKLKGPRSAYERE